MGQCLQRHVKIRTHLRRNIAPSNYWALGKKAALEEKTAVRNGTNTTFRETYFHFFIYFMLGEAPF